MRCLVLINPNSGRAQEAEGAVASLRDAGLEVEIERPKDLTAARGLIKRRAADVDAIVVAGGDGTFHGLAERLVAARKPLGILPLGTANDLARALHIPNDLKQAAKVVAAGRRKRIDLGRAGHTLFFNVATIGLGAEVPRFHRGERKRHLGILSYPISLWLAWRQNRSFRARIECDGTTASGRFIHIAVGNGPNFGGGLVVDEDCRIDDETLYLYAIKPVGLWRLMRLAPWIRAGQLRPWPEVLTLRGKRISVSTPGHRRRLNLDGELNGRTPRVFTVEPKVLEVFVPRAQV
ncbi:lipid kinase, YegS/Rv2252/BmrU family [Tistlia consotensis]|uniref:Lipid kinase, YegS/Rv2252/BmrU family n=1 Tax=Tistlia consotensis USBA 355 TaxID=560819 RepID=A0A1Y6BX98_9PROT|nr:lipid kinase [Tistlia consotensis]SMF33620.1 lipid kinase, YegS/Rv2252/BmrU family [Tistlia consotensis USBA 355]SNR69949.1 lipid kinase, YegS/Rv2252/BmrU family [Tistlia consotensis]